MRLIAIRQARLEPLALSVSDRERMFNGWAAASEDKRIDFSARVAWFGDILNVEGSLMEIGPHSVFANSSVGQAVASGEGSAHNLTLLVGRVPAWGERTAASGQWPVNPKGGSQW